MSDSNETHFVNRKVQTDQFYLYIFLLTKHFWPKLYQFKYKESTNFNLIIIKTNPVQYH